MDLQFLELFHFGIHLRSAKGLMQDFVHVALRLTLVDGASMGIMPCRFPG